MVKTGLERVLAGESRALHGKRVGLLVNPTAVSRDLDFAVDRLCALPDVQVKCLFGPEHGVRGDAQDMIGVGEATDSVTGLPMYSLYGSDESSLAPRPEWLAGLDAVVFDMQDIGSRYYTYVWTLLHVMQVAAPLGVEVIVLDRPNPLGGKIEGGRVQDHYRSFVGRVSIPNRHGLTVGELARYCNATLGLDCKLTVVQLEGWWRNQPFSRSGLPWVMTSPNMPTLDTALVYPGMCLIEGTELSEGRGTTRPFELVGAGFVSYAEARQLAASLSSEALPGVRFRPVVFTPTFHKFGGKRCGGVQLHVTDSHSFDSYATGVAVVRAFRRQHPRNFRWRTRPYEFIADIPAFDLLTGGPEVRELIEQGASLATIRATWAADEKAFADARKPYLLYPDEA